jgi:hypothetical protein
MLGHHVLTATAAKRFMDLRIKNPDRVNISVSNLAWIDPE